MNQTIEESLRNDPFIQIWKNNYNENIINGDKK